MSNAKSHNQSQLSFLLILQVHLIQILKTLMTDLFTNNDQQYSLNVVCVPGIGMSILFAISHLLLTIIPRDDDDDGGVMALVTVIPIS